MRSRLPDLLHLFGGLTPAGVWDMTIGDFHALARAVDAAVQQRTTAGIRERR